MIRRHVALLRGVNVGGKNELPMKRLAALLEELGCDEVETYIQSGNVVFSGDDRIAAQVATEIPKRIASQFGFAVPVIVRTAQELKAAVVGNPFLAEGADPATLHLGFLADRPAKGAVDDLDPDRSPPDRFLVKGREVYFLFPAGLAKSKLTSAWFDRRLNTTITVRNWRTVQKLVDMTAGA